MERTVDSYRYAGTWYLLAGTGTGTGTWYREISSILHMKRVQLMHTHYVPHYYQSYLLQSTQNLDDPSRTLAREYFRSLHDTCAYQLKYNNQQEAGPNSTYVLRTYFCTQRMTTGKYEGLNMYLVLKETIIRMYDIIVHDSGTPPCVC